MSISVVNDLPIRYTNSSASRVRHALHGCRLDSTGLLADKRLTMKRNFPVLYHTLPLSTLHLGETEDLVGMIS